MQAALNAAWPSFHKSIPGGILVAVLARDANPALACRAVPGAIVLGVDICQEIAGASFKIVGMHIDHQCDPIPLAHFVASRRAQTSRAVGDQGIRLLSWCVEGNLDVLRVECSRSGRKDRYRVQRLIEKHGRKANMMKWKEQLNGDWPKRDAHQMHDRWRLDLSRSAKGALAALLNNDPVTIFRGSERIASRQRPRRPAGPGLGRVERWNVA